MRAILLVAILALVGCSGGDGGGGSKSLFSRWTSMDNSFWFDITGQTFDNPFGMSFLFITGEICTCTVEISGTENTGSVRISICSYIGGGGGDPGCNILENGGAFYTYTKSGGLLTLCDAPLSCEQYR